jgi:hypothetical protein
MIHRLFADVLAGLSLLTCGGWATPAVSEAANARDGRAAKAA